MAKIIVFLSLFITGSLYAASISGTVTDESSGDPVAGATVVLTAFGGAGGQFDTVGTTTTDASGDYSFADVGTGFHLVTVSADGYAEGTEFVNVLDANADETVDVALTGIVPGEGSISGAITDSETDEALSGAAVRLLMGRWGNQQEVAATTSGADGSYSFDGLSDGRYTVEVTLDGYDPATDGGIRIQDGNAVTADIALTADVPGTGSITGTITDAGTDEAIAGATITLETGGWIGGEVIATTTSGADGGYTFEGLDAGTYTVEAAAAGYNTARDGGNDVQEGEATTVDMALTAIVYGSAALTVTDAADDSPLAGATVNIMRVLGGGTFGDIITGTTDENGVASFADLEVGNYRATIVLAEYVTTSSNFAVEEGTAAEVTVTMDAVTNEVFLTVSGTVTDADENGIEGATVTLRSGGGGGAIILTAVTDADGAYSIGGIPERVGFAFLTVEAEGYETVEQTVGLAGEDQTIDFTLASTTGIHQEISAAGAPSFTFGQGGVLIIDNIQSSSRLTIHTVKGALLENRMVDEGRQIIPLHRAAPRTVLFLSLQSRANSLKRTLFVP